MTAIAWIVANQLGRRNLDQSQKGALALRLEKQLAEAAKTRRVATLKQNQTTDRIILSEREKGRARDETVALVGPVALRYSSEVGKEL